MPIVPGGPQTLPNWYRWGVRLAPAIWNVADELLDWAGIAEETGDLEWRRLVIEWTRATPSNTQEDVALCTFDLVNYTEGQVDGTWTTTDYSLAEASFNTFLNSVRGVQSPSHVAVYFKWYRMRFASPMTKEERIVPAGPPVRTTSINFPGLAATEALPFQIALSVTERTAIPKHWGRFYLPGLAEGYQGAVPGRWAQGIVDTIAGYVDVLYRDLMNQQAVPVVVSTQVTRGPEGTPPTYEGTLVGVTNIQVDDIPDVIRRRRPKMVSYRKTLPALT